VEKSTAIKSTLLVLAVAVIIVIGGLAVQSSPSDAVTDKAAAPTTTSTTLPAPQGDEVVRISNGSFRPSNVKLALEETWIVKWVNEDPREYFLADKTGLFEAPLPPGAEFQFDYSTVEPGIYRVSATVGAQRIPGTIDSRPDQ
jgi:hypothetical protein